MSQVSDEQKERLIQQEPPKTSGTLAHAGNIGLTTSGTAFAYEVPADQEITQEFPTIKEEKKSRSGSLFSDRESQGKMLSHTKSMNREAIKISFHNLDFRVTVSKSPEELKKGEPSTKELQVLKGVSGYALPGQLTFIMGASGAGKTSLLNLLSDRIARKPGMQLSGDILLNDKHQLNQKLFGRYASYVMQDDVLFAYFTVKEALTFAARLKLNIDTEEQDRRVEQLIEDLGLADCQDTRIGSTLKKLISGGERKRTAIGVELITNPQLILLDEPTSGLDSFTAVRIVSTL